MKTLNAKRITTLAAGAALLGLGVAFGGAITFQNVPIISSSGQPLVQVVVGSSAQPIDAVSAGNIAAAIGNLAYASVPVTATVNATQAASVLKVTVTGSGTSLANQQVWLNESGTAGSSAGTFQFGALIGSVLNGAIILSSPQSTKSLQSGSSTQYAYAEGNPTSLTASPANSPYSAAGSVPVYLTPSGSSNGGGFTLSSFSTGGYDNIMQVTNAQLSSLLNNFGGTGESETLWLTGFPVWNQQTGTFNLMSAGGAYQVTFAKPINMNTGSGSNSINTAIRLLGQNWTIINETGPSTSVTSTTAVHGGHAWLAASLAPLTTVYVGQNLTSGPFKVELTDLGQPNSNGVSQASINVYTNGVLTNTSQVSPGTTTKFNVTGQTLFVNVNQTFAGLYAYQKWAKMQLYNNVYKVTDGQVFNKTNNPGWYADLLWTNTTSGTAAKALQSIILYNVSPTTLTPGQSFNFIQKPADFKLTFVGDQLGSANFDSVTAAVSESTETYQNTGTKGAGAPIPSNLTEPAQLLTVTSGINNAFSYAGQTSSQVVYDLTPYKLSSTGNSVTLTTPTSSNAVLTYTGANALWVSSTYPLTGTITGYLTASSAAPTSASFSFNGFPQGVTLGQTFYNVTNIQITNGRALSGTGFQIVVNTANAASSVALSTLASAGAPQILYPISGQSYQGLSSSSVIYNQQNGQTTQTWAITETSTGTPTAGGLNNLFGYNMTEQAVPSNTAATDKLGFAIYNSTAGVGGQSFLQLNYSIAGTRNNVTYTSTQGTVINANAGFRTERGSKVSAISPSMDTFALAKSVDELSLAVGVANATVSGKKYSLYGPYGVGQATNIANVSIGKVTATAVLASGSYNITGIGNIQAIPSVASATTPVLLKNLSSSAPLVVLDSQAAAAPQSNYILVGSGFVNTLSQQLQSAYNVTFTPSSAPVFQAYGANRILVAGFYGNQTQSAADSFINALYAQATV